MKLSLDDHLRDVRFVDQGEVREMGDEAAADDFMLLRFAINNGETRGDAVVVLPVVSYVHPDDGGDLLDILYNSTESSLFPETLAEIAESGWIFGPQSNPGT